MGSGTAFIVVVRFMRSTYYGVRVSQLHSAEQFRITAWPDAPLPPPLVQRARKVSVDPKGWLRPYGDPSTWAPLPEELVLRQLLSVRCDNADDVVAFTTEHGIITQPPEDLGLPCGLDIKRPREGILHVNEVALYLRHAQAMTLHWIAALDREPVMSAWEAAGVADPAVRMREEVEDETAWVWFTGVLNAGLGGLQPYVRSWTTLPLSGERLEYGAPRVGLFTGLAAQVFNLIVEGLPVRVCANETCQSRFVRQWGRSRKNQQRTTGVMFCSAACAKAQAQRECRRRHRRERR